VTVPAGAGGPTQADTVVGYQAAPRLTTGRESTIIGFQAGFNLTGNGAGVEDGLNTAVGSFALNSETTGTNLVAVGQKALNGCNGCATMVGIGNHAGLNYTSGGGTVIIGQAALGGGTATLGGANNVAVGYNAGAGSGTGPYSVSDVTFGGARAPVPAFKGLQMTYSSALQPATT
jgi:hypothetical protein